MVCFTHKNLNYIGLFSRSFITVGQTEEISRLRDVSLFCNSTAFVSSRIYDKFVSVCDIRIYQRSRCFTLAVHSV